MVEILGVVNDKTPVPPDKTEPPVKSAYQSKVAPDEAVPDKLTVPVPERAPLVVPVTVGSTFTVEAPVPTMTEVAPVELSTTSKALAELALDFRRI